MTISSTNISDQSLKAGLLSMPASEAAAAAHNFLTLLDQAQALVPDPWTVLLLREAFLGNQKFDSLQRATSMPRQTLHQRLKQLCKEQILHRVIYQEKPPRYAYHLTDRGLELHGYALAIWRWQNRWYPENRAMPAKLIHAGCGQGFVPNLRCGECGKAVTWDTIGVFASDREAHFQRSEGRNPRWVGNGSGRPSRSSALLSPGTYILGDRWSCLIIAASFLGIRNFDQLVTVLGIASNILSARLDALRAADFITTAEYSTEKRVFEFDPTVKCLEFLPLLLALITWAQKWLLQNSETRSCLRHLFCGGELRLNSVCGACGDTLLPQDVSFIRHDPEHSAQDT